MSPRRPDGATSADIIVVGGGTSGCVLAARLSEDRSLSVLLLEEGEDDSAYDQRVTDPALAAGVSGSAAFAEPLRLDVAGLRVPLARGRVMGGTSAVNYLAAVRGHPSDYDDWGARGLPQWSWHDVLPAFRRAETDLDFPDSLLHGDTGPLQVRRWSHQTYAPAHAAFAEGLLDIGVPWCPDLNNADSMPGVAAFPASLMPSTGRRLTVSQAYLTPEVRSRPNLHIRSGTRVAELALAGPRAVGVVVATGETLAAGRVVVSAGAVESPALLMRSGIGPADELAACGLRTVVDLPGVGRNLQDHLGPALLYRVRADGVGSGAPAQTVWAHGTSADPRPDVHVFPVLLPTAHGTADERTFAVLVFSLRPESSGSVRLRPDRPDGRPRICLPLPGEREITAAQNAFDVLAGWEASTPVRSRGVVRVGDGRLDRPGAAAGAMQTAPASYAHLVGSCAMGPDTDGAAVLDGTFRVRGVDGLYVVDASAMPVIPTGNTYLTCVMLAERAADFLRAQSPT